MPLMEWTTKLSVGVQQFDEEHQRLVALINELFDAMLAGKGKDVLGHILDGLVSYTKVHFAHEEQFLRVHQFPGFEEHQAEHAVLTEQVMDALQRYRAGAGSSFTMEVLNFLKNWLLKHIQGTDRRYTAFLNDRGVS